MEQITRKMIRPSEYVIQSRARINNRLVVWTLMASAGVFLLAASPASYFYLSAPWQFVIKFASAILTITGVTAFMLDLISLIPLYAAGTIETSKEVEVEGEPIKPGTTNGNGKIKLATQEYSRRQWRILLYRLQEQDWRFNRDVFSGLVGNITGKEVWNSIRMEWEKLGLIYFNDRSYWVVERYREKLLSPPPSPDGNGSSWLLVNDDDNDE